MARSTEPQRVGWIELSPISVRWALEVLPVLGAGSLTLAHFLTAAAFRRRTGAIVAGLERTAAAEIPSSPVPPVIQSFARRAAGGTPVPKIVWLHQTGEIRA